MSDYYKAYEKRYEVVHKSGSLWEIDKPTLEVYDTILKYNIKKILKYLILAVVKVEMLGIY